MSADKPVVAPGELLTGDAAHWLHGKGTYVTEGGLQSSLCGEIQMMDRMVRVEAACSRFVGATGDCVVGRVVAVGAGRWRVNLGAHLDAALMLQNVNLPGGHLRRKTLEDQRQMRELFRESDMVSAEVQKVNRDGSLSLHTRSTRYGKLEGGCLVTVPAVLVRRLASHFHVFACGIEAVIGVNGFVWLRKAARGTKRKRDDADSEEEEEAALKKTIAGEKEGVEEKEEAVFDDSSPEDRVNIARLRAAVTLLAEVWTNSHLNNFSAKKNCTLLFLLHAKMKVSLNCNPNNTPTHRSSWRSSP